MRARIGLVLFLGMAAGFIRTEAAQTEYVFLVTGDGIRWQEVFQGADGRLMEEKNKKSSGIEDITALREAFWAEEEKERRERLMPFFWKTLVKEGVIFGNREKGSLANVRNTHRFSYPGYAEILNGQPVKEVTSNSATFSPRQTVLEYLREEMDLPAEKVALFGSWKIFNWIGMQQEGEIFCNAGYERMPEEFLTRRSRLFDRLQFQMLSPWDTVRLDMSTLELGLDYIRTQEPKVFYLALGESDDWAHNRRYDRTLQAINLFDQSLRRLWTMLQENETYRGKSTIIVTTDHGRGRGLDDWTSHGEKVEGAEEIWIAVFGPDTAKVGEASESETYSLSNVAATMLTLYGLDYRDFNKEAAEPIREAIQKKAAPRQ